MIPDVFSFTHCDGKSAVGTRAEDDSDLLLVVRDEDCDCIAETLTARWDNAGGTLADRFDTLFSQINGEKSIAALALAGKKAAWRCIGDMKLLRFRNGEALPLSQRRESDIIQGDAFLLCTGNAAALLREEEIRIDLLKAENARSWAELLLLRIMERLPAQPEGMSLITISTRASVTLDPIRERDARSNPRA